MLVFEERNDFNWRFVVVHADHVNAFAISGGIIAITDTLLERLKPTRGELAAITGHEMGHIIHRHHLYRVVSEHYFQWLIRSIFQKWFSLFRRKNMSIKEMLTSERQQKIKSAVSDLLVDSAFHLGSQKFSRRNELCADLTAFELLSHEKSKYNPKSICQFLKKLQRVEDSDEVGERKRFAEQVQEWTSTHPNTSDRIEAMNTMWQSLPLAKKQEFSNMWGQ